MHGNLAEWCVDQGGALPGGPDAGKPPEHFRILRGGDFYSDLDGCRSSARAVEYAGLRTNIIGIRPVFTLPEDE